MTSIEMTSHCMTSRYGVHFCIEWVKRPVPKTCKVSIRYVSWFTRYSTTLIIFRMTLVYSIYWLLEASHLQVLLSSLKMVTYFSGNHIIHQLTFNTSSDAYFKLQSSNGSWFFARYSGFIVGPESDNYRLTFDPTSYTGNAGKTIHIILCPVTNPIPWCSRYLDVP